MKCMDCGHRVGNWPDWLAKTSIEVRCARCAGSGAHVINSPKQRSTTPLAESDRRPQDVLEAA